MPRQRRYDTQAEANSARAHSDLMARKSRTAHAAAAEIGEIPAVVKPRRKAGCRRNALRFLTTYFPHSTGLRPFSADHKKIVGQIQRCILDGGRQVNAVYREFAKTTISENLILWAALYGHRRFGLLTGMNKAASTANIDSIKAELADNDLLLEDFPESCFPIRALEGKPQRCSGQTCGGVRTNMTWRADTVVLPHVAKSPAAGCVIMAKPFARARGVKHKRADGVNQRPDLVLVDDPQDNESAVSPLQVKKNLNVLRKELLHASGHDRALAIIVNGTVIAQNDLMETLLVDSAWQGERIKFVQSWSDAHEAFWLKDYATLRRAFDRNTIGDKQRADRAATALYLSRRREADGGCIVSWKERYTRPQEVSAIQHAYNVLLDDGAEVFASEYQNEPLDERTQNCKLTAALVASKTNNLARGVVPLTAEHVTAFIDVHLRLLYYAVVAWCKGFGGSILDYGTLPKQPISYFQQASAPVGMEDQFRGIDEDARILAGLTSLANMLLGATFGREDGAESHVGMLLIDAGWGEKNELVKSFCRRHPQAGTRLMAAQGYGIGPAQTPLAELPLKPGAREGFGWRINPPPAPGGSRWVTTDVNLWKSQVAGRLALALGTPGGVELFGVDPREHSLFADHCVAEAPVETTAKGRTRDVWQWLMPHQDNHWWDCLVGCAVGASMLGMVVPGTEKTARRDPRNRPTLSQLSGRR